MSPASRSSRCRSQGAVPVRAWAKASSSRKGVPVGGHGVAADLALGDQPVGEERLQDRGEGGHGVPPVAASRRPAAKASSSGVPVRYQYVAAGAT